MRAPSRQLRRTLALTMLALTFAIIAVGLVTPAAARAGVAHARTTHELAHVELRGSASAKKAKHSAGNPWGKKDIVEIALLAIAPFAIMGLLMFVSGYRRLHKATLVPSNTASPSEEKPSPR